MKKILLFLLLVVSVSAFSQTPAGYTKINARYKWLAGIFDSSFHAPQYNGVPSGVRGGSWTGSGLVAVDTANHRLYFYSGGSWRYASASTSGSTMALSSLLAATATNDINSANYEQTWRWNSLTGKGLRLLSNTTAGDEGQNLLDLQLSGANALSGIATYGLNVSNGHTGTGAINVGAVFAATGGSSNYAALFTSGNVGIGTSTPAKILHTVGTVRLASLGTASSDTTTNKPLGINSSGDVIPMTYWPGGSGGGVTSLGAIGSSPNANGATISGSTLNLEPASASFGGVITTGTQTFAGAKTFTSDVTITGSYATLNLNATAGTYGGLNIKNAAGTNGTIAGYAGLSYYSPAAYPYHSFNADGGSGQEEIVNISNNLGLHLLSVSGRVVVSTTQNGGLNSGAVTVQSTIATNVNPGNNHRAFNDISSFRNPNASYASFDDNITMGNDTVNQGHHAAFELRMTKDKSNTLDEVHILQTGQINAYGGMINKIYGVQGVEIDTLNGGRVGKFYMIYDSVRTKANANYSAYFGNNVGIGVSLPTALLHVNGTMKLDLGSDATGDILYRNSSGFLTRLPIGTSKQTLHVVAGVPAWLDTAASSGGTPGGSDTYVQFNDGGSFGGDAGMTYNKTLKSFKVSGTIGDYTSWMSCNGGNLTSTSQTIPGIYVYGSGVSGYGMHLGYHATTTYGTEIFSETGQPIYFSQGTGNVPSNYAVGMVLRGDNELSINTTTDNGAFKLQVAGSTYQTGTPNYDATITAAGTTGNQTINKPTGTVNIAAAGTSVTVTNSFCTTSSIVFAVIRTNDGTATIKNVVPGSGSFVITLGAAATAEVSIGFMVVN